MATAHNRSVYASPPVGGSGGTLCAIWAKFFVKILKKDLTKIRKLS
jgi:hypothetical protein